MQDEVDPVLGQFLEFLAQDITMHPEPLRAVDRDLVMLIQSLVRDVEVDRDSPLSPDYE